MRINFKDPIIFSVSILAVSFIVLIIIFALTKPKFIVEISKKGKKKINYYLFVSYSLLFAVLIAIIVFLVRNKNDSPATNKPILGFVKQVNQVNYNPMSYSPHYT